MKSIPNRRRAERARRARRVSVVVQTRRVTPE